MNNTPTPHNRAKFGDFAETCIICGDPLRSKYIAENFLDDYKLVNNVRGIQGYTGYYKGKKVSVMGHGMGIPSISIYVHELYNFYGVKNIIRLGTAGAIVKDVNLADVILANVASTPSNVVENFGYELNHNFAASKNLLEKITQKAKELNMKTINGKVISADLFYDTKENFDKFIAQGAVAVEMEIAALYMLAEKFNKNAVAVLNVTDKPLEGKGLTADERISLMNKLITLCLETAIEV